MHAGYWRRQHTVLKNKETQESWLGNSGDLHTVTPEIWVCSFSGASALCIFSYGHSLWLLHHWESSTLTGYPINPAPGATTCISVLFDKHNLMVLAKRARGIQHCTAQVC